MSIDTGVFKSTRPHLPPSFAQHPRSAHGVGSSPHTSDAGATNSKTEAMLMTTKEVAALLRVAPRTAREWADAGKLPGFKMGRQWRFSRERIVKCLRDASSDF
jgi:excisionase family DNA binding protein